jgi:DNA-binding MarR family transcriptional regulator
MQPSVPDEQRIMQAAKGLMSGIGQLSRTLYRIGDFGLPRSYVNVLTALEAGPRRVGDLAPYIGLTQPRVTVVLQELEERGLVDRRRSTDDRRVTKASLTTQGRELLDQGRQRMAAALLDALDMNVDVLEHTVADAREAVCSLLNALEPEVT